MLLTVKLLVPSFVCGAIAIGALLHWAWELDPAPPPGHVDIGGGIRLPAYMSGPGSQSWWAMVVLMLVAGSLFGCLVFSYLYLWTVGPEGWPSAHELPSLGYALATAAMVAASSGALGLANRSLAAGKSPVIGIAAAIMLIVAGFGVEVVTHHALSPKASGYGAIVYVVVSLFGFYVLIVTVMALFAIARHWAGHLDHERRVTFDNMRIFWHYVAGQSIAGLVLVHGFPRLAG